MGFFKIFNDKSQIPKCQIPDYDNNVIYGNYGGVFIRKVWGKTSAQMNAPSILKQMRDCERICYTTNNPLTFFYRYDMMIKRTIELIYISKYVKNLSVNPVFLANQHINCKQNAISDLIDRIAEKYYDKLDNAKTTKNVERKIEGFESEFEDFHNEIDAENIKKIEQIAKEMRSDYLDGNNREVKKPHDNYRNKTDNIEETIKEDEMLIKQRFDGSAPYKELAVIYHKQKKYEDEKRVILAYRDRNPKLFDTDTRGKYEWFRKRLSDLQTLDKYNPDRPSYVLMPEEFIDDRDN